MPDIIEAGDDLDIELLPVGDADNDAALHGKQPQFRKVAEQISHGDRLLTRANVVGVSHGTLAPDEDPATLLILEFRFISMKKGRRFTSCVITVNFEDSEGDADFCPEVHKIVPDGVYGLNRTEKSRTVKISGTGSISAGIPGAAEANSGLSWEQEQSDTIEDRAQLTGTRYQVQNDDKDDAAIWSMQENSSTSSGIPTFLRTAVLLRREADRPFNATIKVDANVDFSLSQKVADLRDLFGRPKVVQVPRPVGIDTGVDPKSLKVATADPKVVDLTNLDGLDLSKFADVTLITLL